MKRPLIVEMRLLLILVFLVSLTGCTSKTKLMNARLDAAHKRLDALSDDLKTYDEASRARSAEHDVAIRQLERNLTSRFAGEVKAVEADSRRRSAVNEAAIRKLDSNFTGQMQAYDAASRERAAAHEAAMKKLEDSLTAQLATQRQAFYEDNANLRKGLYAIRTELDTFKEQDADIQSSLTKMATRQDLKELIQDVHRRHTATQRVLAEIIRSAARTGRISGDIRSAMQRLIEAHAIFVKGGEDLIAAMEADKAEGGSTASENVYLRILYEQRKAQKRMLQEMQNLLLQAGREMQENPDVGSTPTSKNDSGAKDSQPRK